ncbi:MAG TPA: ferritin family protein [Planctomycetota bacterium]|nr:ferritin family protein [Planctomycetota bacterium]
MPEITIAEAINAAIAMEEEVRGIFLSFAGRFHGAPGAAQFFRSLAQDETGHARLWKEIRNGLPPAKLGEPASRLLVSSLEGARNALERNPPARVSTLGEACELTSSIENAELLAVFRVLAIELVPEPRRREFLDLQIQGHLNRVEQFANGLGRCGRMATFPPGQ